MTKTSLPLPPLTHLATAAAAAAIKERHINLPLKRYFRLKAHARALRNYRHTRGCNLISVTVRGFAKHEYTGNHYTIIVLSH